MREKQNNKNTFSIFTKLLVIMKRNFSQIISWSSEFTFDKSKMFPLNRDHGFKFYQFYQRMCKTIAMLKLAFARECFSDERCLLALLSFILILFNVPFLHKIITIRGSFQKTRIFYVIFAKLIYSYHLVYKIIF